MRTASVRVTAKGAFEVFSQIHLASSPERAVHRCFAGDPSALWSDTEVARVARIDLSEARWALGRFSDAGIVEGLKDGWYRWRPEHRYVLRGTVPPTARWDPVCGMPVSPDARYQAPDLLGSTARFCSERCWAAFTVWKLAFAPRADTPRHLERRADRAG